MNASPRAKCFINAAELMGDGDCEPASARPDVLPRAADCPPAADSSPSPPPPPLPLSGLPPPPPADVIRLQSEEKRKGSLLFNGSGCSTPEAMASPQRRGAERPLCEPLPAELVDDALAGRVWGDAARPDLVAAGEDRGDGQPREQQQAESPSRRQPTSLDDVPIVAGHHEAVTPTPLPPRRPPDAQHVFFVDLNELPAAEPAEKPRPRHGSDSVYLYIDLKEGGAPQPQPPPRRPAGDAMSLSFHGGSTTRPEPAADADGAEDSETAEATARSLFYTVGDTGRPRRPPPELTARVPRQEKRRRNLSLDCHARTERERPAAATGASPLLGSERTARPAGRGSLGATPEAARRTTRTTEPRRQESRPRPAAAGGRHSASSGPSRREDPESGMERDSLESVGPPRRPAASSAPPRRRSAQRAEPVSRRAPPPPVDPKPAPQRSFLRSHSGRNAVSRPDRVTTAPPPPPPQRPPTSSSGGSGGTLTRRKAAARPAKPPSAPPPQQRRPAPRPPSPRDSPPASDDASDVSSGKSFRRREYGTGASRGNNWETAGTAGITGS